MPEAFCSYKIVFPPRSCLRPFPLRGSSGNFPPHKSADHKFISNFHFPTSNLTIRKSEISNPKFP